MMSSRFREIVGIRHILCSACFAVSVACAEARHVTALSLDAENMTATAVCSAGDATVTNVLYYVWSNDGAVGPTGGAALDRARRNDRTGLSE